LLFLQKEGWSIDGSLATSAVRGFAIGVLGMPAIATDLR
jgi:hypothetical protein